MTRNDDASTYPDLLARLAGDGTKELFRRLLEEALQELIDAELTAEIGLIVTSDPTPVPTTATAPDHGHY